MQFVRESNLDRNRSDSRRRGEEAGSSLLAQVGDVAPAEPVDPMARGFEDRPDTRRHLHRVSMEARLLTEPARGHDVLLLTCPPHRS